MNTRALIGKLSGVCRQAVEKAATIAVNHNHYAIELEHLLLALVETDATSVRQTMRKYGLNPEAFSKELETKLETFSKGNTSAPSFSPRVIELIRKAWLLSSLEYGQQEVTGIALIVALFKDDAMKLLLSSQSMALQQFDSEGYINDGPNLIRSEAQSAAQGEAQAGMEEGGSPSLPAGKKALEEYTLDLTARARAGELDPVVGREPEIRQLIDILCRRRQNNPILTGEAGVGKTAVVEGLALRIVEGSVPDVLADVDIRILDLTLLQAGAGVRGEFENRLKSVVDEVKQSTRPVILFIDEAHTLIGAGNSGGQGDAANILKPALARGELRTIAATTWAEYKKYFEKDAALTRRFQVVKVEEPEPDQAMRMLRTLQSRFEQHHSVMIMDDAIKESVLLSKRYISGRQLPDVGVSVLDTACSRVNLEQRNTPALLDDITARIDLITKQLESLKRENTLYGAHQEEIAGLEKQLEELNAEQEELTARWQQEQALVDKVIELRAQLHNSENSEAEQENDPQQALMAAQEELTAVQGEYPLVRPHVDGQVIAEVISSWTGIPVGKMVSGEIQKVLTIQNELEKRIIGQDHALEAVTQSMRVSRAKLTDPRQPIGVFMFCGSSGIGKTETALALADLMYGGEQNLTVINMSEFKEEHKVSLLMGSPPGYVGYGEGGVLTEAVRRKPYSVILLDEIEKAHPGVQDIFYQVFDKGAMKDGEGRDIDFRNTLIIMTTNAGTETISRVCADPDTMPEPEQLESLVKDELLEHFKPAFLGRTRIVPFTPLSDDVMAGIVRLQLERVGQRIQEQYRASYSYTDKVIETIVARCQEVDTGARNAIHIINRRLLPDISMQLLEAIGNGTDVTSVLIDVDEQTNFNFQLA
ncbi:MAG: type VI secretion system ATPase TssH [Chromatiales bacterium]|nr:type VI secretion system ATPase TssH [Chromatiales bacterium]